MSPPSELKALFLLRPFLFIRPPLRGGESPHCPVQGEGWQRGCSPRGGTATGTSPELLNTINVVLTGYDGGCDRRCAAGGRRGASSAAAGAGVRRSGIHPGVHVGRG